MASSPRLKFVVENDSFLRLIQVVLDPSAPEERIAAFSHFCAHDLPDFAGWCETVRSQRKIFTQQTSASSTIKRSCWRTSQVLRPSSSSHWRSARKKSRRRAAASKIVQKYGVTTPRIDRAACDRAGVQVLTLRRRANISTAEQALTLMLALARQLNQNANLISDEQLRAAGYEPTRYDRSHTPNGNWARITGLITLYQRQLGIIGLGEIGRELALRAAALEMRIVYTQRHRLPADVEQRYRATYCTLG